jgi:hypothetical protein
MSLKLDALLEKQPYLPAETPVALRNLSGASSDELRHGLQGVIDRMRAFNTELKARRMREYEHRPEYRHLTDDEYAPIFKKEQEERAMKSEAEKAEFNAVYRPEALAYRDEIRRRLGLPNIIQSERDSALDFGMLSGVDPINDSITALEKLVRKLF